MKVLIAGGAGFIGSTIASACLDAGITPVVLDNLVTGRREFTAGRVFYEGDIADGALLDRIFTEHPDIDAAVHCAALIVVPESVARPVHYYRENVAKTLEFVASLLRHGCGRLLFSSSAALYRPGADFSVDEDSPIEPLSPYARTKSVVEDMLRDVAAAEDLRVLSLRYFNPVGADPALRTGLQVAAPTHALGVLIGAAAAGRPFPLTGTAYPTRDGTGIRDYVHVWDLAAAHLAALGRFDVVLPPRGADGTGSAATDLGTGSLAINLGAGTGTTVRELVTAFEAVTGTSVDVVEQPARPGDTAGAYTRSTRAAELLGWRPRLSLEEGIRHSLEWSSHRDRVLVSARPTG